jgi:hypothetical protein
MGKAEHNMGFARIDIERHRRCGLPEVVFCPGKTPAQVASIMRILSRKARHAYATRATREQFDAVL